SFGLCGEKPSESPGKGRGWSPRAMAKPSLWNVLNTLKPTKWATDETCINPPRHRDYHLSPASQAYWMFPLTVSVSAGPKLCQKPWVTALHRKSGYNGHVTALIYWRFSNA